VRKVSWPPRTSDQAICAGSQRCSWQSRWVTMCWGGGHAAVASGPGTSRSRAWSSTPSPRAASTSPSTGAATPSRSRRTPSTHTRRPRTTGAGVAASVLCILKLAGLPLQRLQTRHAATLSSAWPLVWRDPCCCRNALHGARLLGTVRCMPGGVCGHRRRAGRRKLAVRSLWLTACSWR